MLYCHIVPVDVTVILWYSSSITPKETENLKKVETHDANLYIPRSFMAINLKGNIFPAKIF